MNASRKVYYVANARMPSEKAYAIQIAKVCEAMIEAGTELEIIAPRRGVKGSMRESYHLRVDVPLRYVPVLPLYRYGRIGYFIESCFFMVFTFLLLLAKRLAGERFIVYTVDTDTFSYVLLPYLGVPVYIEVHDYKPRTMTTKSFFPLVTGVIATTEASRSLTERLGTRSERIIVEPNGVDMGAFSHSMSKREARERLGLASDEKIALYAGRFYEWKGLEILSPAFERIPDIVCMIIGGSEEEFLRVTGRASLPSNMRIMGSKDVVEVPLWLAAADTLIVIGTTKNTSSLYIAPMKVYENMATHRPVVIGRTDSHQTMASDAEVYFYKPDDPSSLAEALRKAIVGDDDVRIERAYQAAIGHSWQARTERIHAFIERTAGVQ